MTTRQDTFTRVSDGLGARLSARMSADIGHRPDLHIGDYRMAGAQLATIAIGFSKDDYGAPTIADVEEYLIRASKGRLCPLPQSGRINRERGTLTIMASQQRQFAPFSEMERQLAKVGPNRYMRIASENEVWELENVEGKPIVYRVAEENLEDIISEIKGSQVRSTSARVAHTQNGDATVMAPMGADVHFFDHTGKARIARVTSEPDSEGYVQATGADFRGRVHINSISSIVRTAEMDGATKSRLENYFAEMFGDKEYAKDLVREASITGNSEELVAFLTDSGMYDVPSALDAVDDLRRRRGSVVALGPINAPELVYAKCNGGNSFEWELDVENMTKLLKAQARGEVERINAGQARVATSLEVNKAFVNCASTKAIQKKFPSAKLYVYRVPGSAGEDDDAYAMVVGDRFVSPDLNPDMARMSPGTVCSRWELGRVQKVSGSEVMGPIEGEIVSINNAIQWLGGAKS